MRKLFLTLTFFLLCNLGFSQNVIDPRLQDVMNQKGDEMIDINIIFKSQIDYKQLRNRANTTLDKEVRRDMMVDELKLFSEEKQKDVLSILQAETRGLQVTNIRTYWLSNAISCTASRDVIYLLAKHPDIEIIGYDEWQRMIPEESPQDHKSTSQRADDIDMTDNIKMVNADKVWDLGYTGKGVTVAILDTGINIHTDIIRTYNPFFVCPITRGIKNGFASSNQFINNLLGFFNADIKAALESGKVGSYVVDFPTEETVNVPGIVAIPHLGASTPESEDNCAVMAAKELKDFIENGNITNSVNKGIQSIDSFLKDVKAKRVSGENVVVESGCIIDVVEYSNKLDISSKAEVKKIIKL